MIPVPYEATTSYGKGTKGGPAAIISASKHVETFDEELCSEPYLAGIHTLPPIKASKRGLVMKAVSASISKAALQGKVPIMLGGEHSISPFALAALKKQFNDISVLQIDAHTDLRDSYEGSRWSHATAARRILDICPAVQVGIRNISADEWDFAEGTGQIKKIHFADKFGPAQIKKIVGQLSGHVYVTIDVDGLDPSIMPSTGTPEPGGLLWGDVTALLKAVSIKKRVVGFDIVELSPIKGVHAPDFTAAKLVYKLIGYILRSPAQASQ